MSNQIEKIFNKYIKDDKLIQQLIKNCELDKLVEELAKVKITKKRAKKDKNSPKHPLNAYMFYCNEVRVKIKQENEGMDAKNITKVIAKKWNSMDEDQKKPYVQMSLKDKERFSREIEDYKKQSGDEEVKEEPPKPKRVVKPKKEIKSKAQPKEAPKKVANPKPVKESAESESESELSDE